MSSLRSTSLSVMRPPKPPCWRDFVVSTPKSIHSEGVDVADTAGRTLGARSPVADLVETSRGPSSLPGSKPSRLSRRPRARIHRTRSEHVIHAEDLPESVFTATLADADPKGLRVKSSDGRLYVEENNRRCQSWLASIEAAEPLDEVVYTGDQQSGDQVGDEEEFENGAVAHGLSRRSLRHSENELIPIDEMQQGVDVEIPEETFIWDVSGLADQQSPSSGEDNCGVCKKLSNSDANRKSSETPPTSATDSNLLTGNTISKNRRSADCDTGDRHIVENVPNGAKCGKTSCGKKLYKLCCDHQDTQSVTYNHGMDSGYGLQGDIGDRKVDGSTRHKAQDVTVSQTAIDSSKTACARSTTRRYARKLLSDSEITGI